jgi:probable F420-dependent oxidoreductase
MKFGINILNFGRGCDPESLERWARLAEGEGYHFLMISDHVAITPDVQELFSAPFYDPFTTLAWIAGFTDNIELGTTVAILPYRHPLLTARMAANVDQISGGRFIFGVGAGWAKQEFDALGIPFNRRGAITDEYLEVIKACWTEDVVSYQGRFVSFKDVQTEPRPRRSPQPPIWVGGSSEGALRRAVRYGDAWHPIRARMDWLRDEGLPALRRLAKMEGKAVPRFCPRLRLRITQSPLADDQRPAGQGTIEQIHRDLEQLAALGAEYVLFDTYGATPESARHPEDDWSILAELTERVIDLASGSVR